MLTIMLIILYLVGVATGLAIAKIKKIKNSEIEYIPIENECN
jgi:uncharacterized membrane protein